MATTIKKAAAEKKARGAKLKVVENEPEREPEVEVKRSNVTDATIIEYTHEYLAARSDEAKAKEEYDSKKNLARAVLKRAKKAGIDTYMLTWYDQNRHREIDDINRDFTSINRIAKLMALPVGTQIGLFEDGETVAAKVDKAAIAKQSAKPDPRVIDSDTAYKMGKAAGLDGKNLVDANRFPAGSDQAEAFQAGWEFVQKQRAEQLGNSAPAGEA